MSIKATPTGQPECEHTEHEARVVATLLVAIHNGQEKAQRFVAVCDYHQDYGDRTGVQVVYRLDPGARDHVVTS